MKPVRVEIALTAAEAVALAQFCKRSTYECFREYAVDDEEATVMVEAIECLRRGLAEAGFTPR